MHFDYPTSGVAFVEELCTSSVQGCGFRQETLTCSLLFRPFANFDTAVKVVLLLGLLKEVTKAFCVGLLVFRSKRRNKRNKVVVSAGSFNGVPQSMLDFRLGHVCSKSLLGPVLFLCVPNGEFTNILLRSPSASEAWLEILYESFLEQFPQLGVSLYYYFSVAHTGLSTLNLVSIFLSATCSALLVGRAMKLTLNWVCKKTKNSSLFK